VIYNCLFINSNFNKFQQFPKLPIRQFRDNRPHCIKDDPPH
jgi:hypothetical protein